MAINGEQVIKKGERILTICNTGQLATAGIGTAFGVCAYSHKNGKNIHVYACETRPLLQGGRLTAWELGREGIPHTLICDSMAGFLMQQKKIDRILVGADRIARNGDFANKIGSYSLAVLAHYHQIPYHVVAPYTTIDPHCANGAEIEVEERNPDEVRGLKMGQKELLWAPASSPVYNPAFDVTPNELVTSYFLDKGIFTAENLAKAYT
jgi:methylthioribose-1-phosphate isomerase